MTLIFVEPGEKPDTINTLLYGPPGAGKSVAAGTAPGPILVLNAEGPNALRKARELSDAEFREVELAGSATLDEAYLYLAGDGKDVRTVVVDTIGEVYRVLLEELAGTGPAKIQHYGEVNTKIERFVRALRDLPVNLVLIAHESVDDIEGIPTRRPLTGGKKLPEQLMAQVDVVAYCQAVPGEGDNPTRYMGQLVEGRGRRAKDRSGALGKARELNITEWIEAATSKEND